MRIRARSALTPALGALLAACTLLVDADLKNPIGAQCGSSDDCQASVCQDGLCVKQCGTDLDCPRPSACFGALCQLPLKVGALWSGVGVGGDGWTHTHKIGLDEAADALHYLRFDDAPYLFREGVRTPDAIERGIDDYIAQGADVIVTTSLSQRDVALAKAQEYPRVKFLTCGGFKSNGTNVGSFFGRYEQAWYVGGKMAALKAKRRIGYVAPLSTTGVVRFINAFTRGAQSVNPSIVVEVRWLGFWQDLHDTRTYDYAAKNFTFATDPADPSTKLFREELLAARLVDGGSELVVHETDTQRTVAFIDRRLGGVGIGGAPVLSMAVDIKDGCRVDGDPRSRWQPSCLGAIYWSWAPLYEQLFDQIHRGTWQAGDVDEPLSANVAASPFYFELNFDAGISTDQLQSAIVAVASQDYRAVLKGPYEVTGQRDKDGDGVPDAVQSVADGEVPSEEELGRACWFVKGVVEKSDPTDPASPDRDAHVPDGPNGHYPPPADTLEYVKDYPFIVPDHDLNCPKNL